MSKFTYLLIAHILFAASTDAQREGFIVPKWIKLRMFSVSTDAPMLMRMLPLPGFNESAHLINTFVSHVDAEILSSLRNGTSPSKSQTYRPCTVLNRNNIHSIRTIFGSRGLPEPIYDCTTYVVGTQLYEDRAPIYPVNAVFDAIHTVKRLLDREKTSFIQDILMNWAPWYSVLHGWDEPSVPLYYPWVRRRKHCKITGTSFMRVYNYWYMILGITNAPPTHKPRLWKRQHLEEHVYVGPRGRRAHALRIRIPSYVSDEKDGPPVDNTTTLLLRKKGPARPNSYYPLSFEKNPAVLDAMDAADRSVRQIDDALSSSQLSILFLPIVLNLVPVALFTDVGPCMHLVYMVCSDLLTVVPLAVKGFELLVIASNRFRSVAVRMENDSRGFRNLAAAAHVWTVECRAEINSRAPGIAFLSVSILAAVVGIWLELWAIRFMRRRQKIRLAKLALFGKISKHEMYENYAI